MHTRPRLIALTAVTLVVLAAAVFVALRPFGRGFATPSDCLDAYCEACLDRDAERYLACLAEPLRSETRRRFPEPGQLAEHLRVHMNGVVGWAQHLPTGDADSVATVELEETRHSSRRLTAFRLERSGKGWLIVSIGASREEPLPFRPGTSVDEGREGSGPRTEP